VGIIGTGASAAQLIPRLAQDAKKLYVFQRTPSSVVIRDYNPTDAAAFASQKPGWQQAKMNDFANILQGEITDTECTALEGLESMVMRTIFQEAEKSGVTVLPEQIPKLFQLADFRKMESVRKLIEDIVKDKATAAKLKPWYPFMCKRPVFQNEYLSAFNKPNVELVDTDGKGVTRITETGVVANDKEYEVDILVYSTGYDFDVTTSFYRGTRIKVIGTKGRSPDETWQEKGPATLFGIHIREFPNLFNIGLAQSGVTANWLHTVYAAGDHIAEFVGICLKDGTFQAFEPTAEAQEDWGKQIEEGSEMRLQFAQACPPGYYNNEGKPEEVPIRSGVYPKGIVAWTNLTREWREEGSMKGIEKR
jgi:cation diffusion facilitator CzcD-associated flavoprotein CzcO